MLLHEMCRFSWNIALLRSSIKWRSQHGDQQVPPVRYFCERCTMHTPLHAHVKAPEALTPAWPSAVDTACSRCLRASSRAFRRASQLLRLPAFWCPFSCPLLPPPSARVQ